MINKINEKFSKIDLDSLPLPVLFPPGLTRVFIAMKLFSLQNGEILKLKTLDLFLISNCLSQSIFILTCSLISNANRRERSS